uniref:Uncharacterized protein n=1 Tax=Timema shepardi TaxID=629360 RepID=A0A7R9AXE8_TIMSH|nr:unnamed protein product [Timema shepardi]
MNSDAMLKVALHSRSQADLYLSKGEWGRAFPHLLVALKLYPEWKSELKKVFSTTLSIWGELLEDGGRYDDLFKCYEQALEVFADHEEVLNNLGAHLYRLGHLQEACLYFRQAQDVCSDFLPALKNLQSCCNLAVERWHYRMLNDSRRNQGFRSAITRAVGQGFNTVLDIGCGTGILSLFALEAGAIEVFACDGSHSMVQLAAKVLEANNAADKVKHINKLSYDLKVPQDLPSRPSLIVTETLDAGLFGEHILQTVSHAWDSLLAPGGRVIPAGATLWVCAVECPHLAARYQLKEDSTGLDWRGIHLYSAGEEQYDCEDLNSLPGGFRFLIEPVPALLVDFNDPEELQKTWSGKRNTTKLCKVLESGEVHVVLAWFTLQLDAQEELSTCPIDEHKAECWDQAVFPLVRVQYVRAGQYLELQVGYHGGKLSVSVHCCGSNAMKEKTMFKKDDNQPKMDSKDTNEGSDNGIVFNNSMTIEPKSGSSNIDSEKIDNVSENMLAGKARTSNVSNRDKHKISLEISPEMFNVSPEIGNVTKSDKNSSIDEWEGGFNSKYDKCSVSFKGQTTATNFVRELHDSANSFIGETCTCNCNYLNIENHKQNILRSGVDKVVVNNETLYKKETDDKFPVSRLSHKFSKMPCPLHMKTYFVPQKVIRFLNDKSWMDTFSQVAVDVLQTRGKCVTQFDILDLSPFPVLGLHLMKGIENARLWCISSEIREVVLSVFDVNGVSAERIQFINLEDGQENLSCSTFKFDLVVAHMFDSTGELSGSAIAMLPLIKKCLKEDGLILPQKITFQSMAVHSDWLERMSRVINNNVTCGYDIDRFINMYQVSHHLDFLLSSIPHTSHSCMMQLLSVNTGDIPSLEMGGAVSVPITRNGCVNALVYWFSVTYMEGILPISTLRNDSHIHQAAVLLHPGVPVKEGDNLNVVVMFQQGEISTFLSSLTTVKMAWRGKQTKLRDDEIEGFIVDSDSGNDFFDD